MTPARRTLSTLPALVVATAMLAADLPARQGGQKTAPTPGPMLAQGTFTIDTPEFRVELVRSSQTVAALRTKDPDAFDFTPGDLLVERSQDGYYHLGDIDLRVRAGTAGDWKPYSTAVARLPVTPLPASPAFFAAADLAPALPPEIPLAITRSWRAEAGRLVLRFELKNRTADIVQIGALGIPLVFNNVLSNRPLDKAHETCVFFDPYIGEDAGYVQVTRLNGKGPALLVVPDGRTRFEAYNPILNPRRAAGSAPAGGQIFTDATPRGTTFEGFFDWMVHSQAFAENEWKDARPWNPPTLVTLRPGESASYGLAFVLAPEIRAIEKTLTAKDRPVVVGIPGYVLATDTEARLFIKYGKPVVSVAVEPRDALSVTGGSARTGGWRDYALRALKWGRARLVVTYADGTVQAVHYTVIKPASEAVSDLGRFLTTRQWFVDPADPFKRSPSVMSFDREANRIVTEDSRVWIAGLGDEGGSAWLSGAMKALGQPDQAELAKYQEFIDKVVWGGLQHADGPRAYAVRKSLFYYQPDQMPPGYYRADLNWGTWTSWKRDAAEAVDRSYDYPHVAALHWSMYRLARNTKGLVTNRSWQWYLNNAYQTAVAMTKYAPHYAQFGQMEGSVFLEILRDLRREAWSEQAADLESRMKARAEVWMKLGYPFGSEMPWDSTGQEEVYAWTKYFGDAAKSSVTLNAILAYMPAVPHWGYNGSARRYWDFQYAGKIRRIERQLHHYGSGLNAIPVLTEYREHPDDFYLLRVGYAGMMGALAGIDQEGFASAAFHSFPDTLRFDPYSGDYAPNFFGHALNTATYVVRHPEFGWLAFGGNLKAGARLVEVTPLDSFRTRVYLAPLGMWLTLDAGHFERIEVDLGKHAVRIDFAQGTATVPDARLRVEQPAEVKGVGRYIPKVSVPSERGAFVIPLKWDTVSFELVEQPPKTGGSPGPTTGT
jgi:hypothetical protein